MTRRSIGSIEGIGFIAALLVGGSGLSGCASSQTSAAGAASAGDEVAEAKEGGAKPEGDDELEGDDYLVQVKAGEYRVGKVEGRAQGLSTFTVEGQGSVKTGSYYQTVKAARTALHEGIQACFFKDNEKGDVYMKPVSKAAARGGAWRCRVVRNVSDMAQGTIYVGDDKVSVDNVRMQRKDEAGLE